MCLCLLGDTNMPSSLISCQLKPHNHLLCSPTPSRSEESFKQYFSEMPWLAVPYSDEARRSRLNRLYGIQGILQPPSKRLQMFWLTGEIVGLLLFFLPSLVMSHTNNGCQLSVLGWQTATQTALQPEECGLVIKFTVLFTAEVLRLSLRASLFSSWARLPCVCRGLWMKLARAGSPAKECEECTVDESTLPLPCSSQRPPRLCIPVLLTHSVCWQMLSVFDEAHGGRKKVVRSDHGEVKTKNWPGNA